MKGVLWLTMGSLVGSLILLGCGVVPPWETRDKRTVVAVLPFYVSPGYITPEIVGEAFASRLIARGCFLVVRGGYHPSEADLMVSGAIWADRKVGKGFRIPFLLYLTEVRATIKMELRISEAKNGKAKLVRVLNVKRSWRGPLQFLSFDAQDPSLFPPAIEERELWEGAVEELAEQMCRAVLEVVPPN